MERLGTFGAVRCVDGKLPRVDHPLGRSPASDILCKRSDARLDWALAVATARRVQAARFRAAGEARSARVATQAALEILLPGLPRR